MTNRTLYCGQHEVMKTVYSSIGFYLHDSQVECDCYLLQSRSFFILFGHHQIDEL